jgi:hypothetical protein
MSGEVRLSRKNSHRMQLVISFKENDAVALAKEAVLVERDCSAEHAPRIALEPRALTGIRPKIPKLLEVLVYETERSRWARPRRVDNGYGHYASWRNGGTRRVLLPSVEESRRCSR